MSGQLASVVAVLAVGAAIASAAETDQYWAWGQPLADSTAAVNAKLNLELERAVNEVGGDRARGDCRKVAAAFRSRMRSLLFHDIMIWAWNSRLVDRAPNDGDEQRRYRATNLYSRHPLIDPASWMPYAPTILVADVRFGIDKLSHFVSSGWTTYSEYHRRLSRGSSPEEALDKALRRGVLEELLILGRLASGVFSISDLEANYSGFRMYRDLCDAADPILVERDGRWQTSRRLDVADYVNPRWDESYQPTVYSKRRWRTVRPVLEDYCHKKPCPQSETMTARYRERDSPTPVAPVVAEAVASGRFPDPAGFSLAGVCTNGRSPGRDSAHRRDDSPTSSTEGIDDIRQAILDEEADRRRFVLTMPGAALAYPQVISASLGFMMTTRIVGWDCRTPCRFKGPFVEIEPGLGGGKLSVGWARLTGVTGDGGGFLNAVFMGTAVKLTMLRTWSDDGWLPAGRTYAGIEVAVMPAQLNIGLGALVRVDGGDGAAWTVTAGLGWGF